MKTTTFLKGLALVAVIFMLANLEAAAQLPVRTQQLQLINPLGGVLTQDLSTGVASTSYTVSWPGDASAYLADGDEAILIGTRAAANDINLRWELSDGFVDGSGADNHVAFWNPDDNTLDAQESFEFDPATGILGLGVDDDPSGVVGLNASTSGEIRIGNAAQANNIQFIGTSATANVGIASAGTINVGDGTDNEVIITGTDATVSVGTTTAGNVNVNDGAGVAGIQLDGNGTGTYGNDGITGTFVMYDGGAAAAANTVTLTTGTQTVNWPLEFDAPTAAPVGTYYSPVATNTATTATQLLISNGDGTATWADNPTADLKSGIVTPAAAAYSAAVTFTTPYAATPVVTVTAAGPVANGYVLQVTGVTVNGFTVLSSAPFDGTDTVSWIANAPYNP